MNILPRLVALLLVTTTLAVFPASSPVVASAPAACPAAGWDCPLVTPGAYVTEPTVHFDASGAAIICGPHGVPSSSGLWRLDATRHFLPLDTVPNAPLGGGDCDFQLDAKDRLYMIDLWLGGNSIASSSDKQHWDRASPVTFKIPVGDRQWIDAAGDGVVYILWRNLVDGVWVARSTDGGVTFAPETLVSATATKGGNLVIDRTDPTLNTVYAAWSVDRVYQNNAGLAKPVLDEVYLAKTTNGGLTWSNELVRSGHSNLGGQFPVVTLDVAGNPYVTWTETDSNGANAIWMSARAKDSTTWSAPARVNQDAATTNTFPWIIAGDAGRVAIAWYGADYVGSPDDHGHDWFLHVATSTNALAAAPSFTDAKLEKVKYNHWICTKGTLCAADGLDSPGRELGDFLTIEKDARGAIAISYNGQQAEAGAYSTRYIHQACGEGLFAATGPLEGSGPCAPAGVPGPLPTTVLSGTYYAHGLAPVHNVDGLAAIFTPVTFMSQQPPTSAVPKVASNGATLGGTNAGTIYDAHWFIDAPANGLSLSGGDITVHLYVTSTGVGKTATVAIYDAGSGTFAPIGSTLASRAVPLAPGQSEVVVTFSGLSGKLSQGFELFVSADTGVGDAQVLYDATSAPTSVTFG